MFKCTKDMHSTCRIVMSCTVADGVMWESTYGSVPWQCPH